MTFENVRSSIGIETQGWDAPLDINIDPLSESVPLPSPQKQIKSTSPRSSLPDARRIFARIRKEREREIGEREREGGGGVGGRERELLKEFKEFSFCTVIAS